MEDNQPSSPVTPKHKRGSLAGLFDDMNIERTGPRSSPKKERDTNRLPVGSNAGRTGSLLRDTFRRAWPPSVRGGMHLSRGTTGAVSSSQPANITLRMSDLYRVYGDGWASSKPGTKDEAVDLSGQFEVMTTIMGEIQSLLRSSTAAADVAADFLVRAMADVVYGSNQKARKGLGLDDTIALCMAVFDGASDPEYGDRPDNYQEQLEKLVHQQLGAGERHVVRSRREVVQHAMAFQYLVTKFVKEEHGMTEQLIKETHAILVKGSSGEDAGILGTREYGGIYRTEDVYVGTHRFPRPARIREDMRAFVMSLSKELEEGERVGQLDPIALASKYCDRFVNIHPFRDGNGRMCRLILNAILVRYAGVVVNVGGHDQMRDEYIDIARESREVGGHPGALATLVLRHATKTCRKMRDTVKGKLRAMAEEGGG